MGLAAASMVACAIALPEAAMGIVADVAILAGAAYARPVRRRPFPMHA